MAVQLYQKNTKRWLWRLLIVLSLVTFWSPPAFATSGVCPPGFECDVQTIGNVPYNYLYGYPPFGVPFQYATGEAECQRYLGATVVETRWIGDGYECLVMYQGMQYAGFAFTREYPYRAGCSLVGGTASGSDPNKICVGAKTCPDPSINPTIKYTYSEADQLCERPVTCIPPNTFVNGQCETPETYTITLDQTSADLQPALAAANVDTFKIFVATVTGNRNGVKAYTPVTIKSEVTQGTGGHVHTDTLQRPKGYLYSDQTNTSCDGVQPAACITGNTDANGQFAFTFLASQVAGKHTVTATCDVCNGGKADLAIKVAVPGLSGISASPFYALNEANGDVIGARAGWHTDNHNLNAKGKTALLSLAEDYHLLFPADPVLYLNDASLPQGGVFDICARPGACATLGVQSWTKPHAEHRRGTVIDIRANNTSGAIPVTNRLEFETLIGYMGMSYLHESQGTSNEHYHVRLLGRGE